jgi:membrane protein required for colicin V production
MSSVDIIIVIVILLSGALGIYWGFIRQVLSLAGLIAGLVFASRYGAGVADALSSFVASDTLARVLGFGIVLIGVSAAASFMASLLRRFVGLLFLGWLDHLAGGLLGLLQGSIICTIFLLAAATFPLALWAPAVADSRFAPALVRTFSFLLPLLPASFHVAAQMTFGLP